jgi:hypothetical protein
MGITGALPGHPKCTYKFGTVSWFGHVDRNLSFHFIDCPIQLRYSTLPSSTATLTHSGTS